MSARQRLPTRKSNARRAAAEGQRVLRQRLREVGNLISPAATRWRKSGEPVHRLRVAARRAVAAVDLLQPLLPRRNARRLRRMLQQIRRACDAARDSDVLIKRVERHGNGHGHSALIRRLQAQRRRDQGPIVAIHRQLGVSGRWDRRTRKLLAKVRWDRRDATGREPGYATFIRRRLAGPADRFEQALRARHTSSKSLHRLCIRGKRLRYALELAGAAVPHRRREQLDAILRELQDHLGEINDSAMARAALTRGLAAGKKSFHTGRLKTLWVAEEKASEAARKAFVKWRSQQSPADFQDIAGAGNKIRRPG